MVVIQEAGLDGFSIHRALEAKGWIASHVVDAASIAVSRRHRWAKTDRIDGETLVRTLMAWMRGEPRVCSMVRVPAVEDEDHHRIARDCRLIAWLRIFSTTILAVGTGIICGLAISPCPVAPDIGHELTLDLVARAQAQFGLESPEPIRWSGMS